MPRPDLQEVPEHLREEIILVKQDDLKQALMHHPAAIDFLKEIPEEKWSYSYGPGKWTIKSVVQHIIDGERIFCNRALVIARKDKTTPLVSFDQDNYADCSQADRRTKEDLLGELVAVQQSSIRLFASFNEEQLQTKGSVGSYTIDVNALGFVVIGHTLHHLKIIRERYQ